MNAIHTKLDQRYRLPNFVQKKLEIDGSLTYEPDMSMVCVGSRQFEVSIFGWDCRGSETYVVVAHDRDYVAARIVSKDELREIENADCVDWDHYPHPWSDANALEAIARHWLDVDSVSIVSV